MRKASNAWALDIGTLAALSFFSSALASPVAWQHVNLYGRYEFRKQPEPVDVDEIVRELAEIRIGTVRRFGGVMLD